MELLEQQEGKARKGTKKGGKKGRHARNVGAGGGRSEKSEHKGKNHRDGPGVHETAATVARTYNRN